MSQLKKEDLVEGEIYKHSNGSICKWGKNDSVCNIVEKFKGLTRFPGGYVNLDFTIATPEQKHWLETCIKEDKFISYEEAMKTLIPEYVEAISNKHSNSEIIGTIYKTSKLPNWVNGHQLNQYWKDYIFHYKPSTKEAYDAQFVVKEPEFVLPEKWCIKGCDQKVIDYSNKFGTSPTYYLSANQYHHYPPFFCHGICTTSRVIKENYTEITFEQFKKYVLKETEENKISLGISPLKLAAIEHPHLTKVESKPFEILSIVNNITKEQLDLKKDGYFRSKFSSIHLNNVNDKYSIVSVANEEGNVFNINDKVISVKAKKKTVQTIKLFQYSADKLKIQAVTTLHIKGINIKRLEHFIEVEPEFVLPETKLPIKLPVVEETLLEQAKRLYPIGTKFKCIYNRKNSLKEYTVSSKLEIHLINSDIKCFTKENYFKNVYDSHSNKWAEIVGYEPQIGDKFEFLINSHKQFIIKDFKGSYDNPNSIITFENNVSIQTILLKNIKIIK